MIDNNDNLNNFRANQLPGATRKNNLQQLKQLKSTTSARETTHLALKEGHGEYAVSETKMGYRCAIEGIVMCAYQPVMNPSRTRKWRGKDSTIQKLDKIVKYY